MGYNPWGLKELDTTEQLHLSLIKRDALEKSSESRMCEAYGRAAHIAHYGELKSPSTKRD